MELDTSAFLELRLDDMIPSMDPGQVTFWSGAGISVDAPTNNPDGFELTQSIVRQAFDEGTLGRIQEIYVDLGIPRDYPRLETMMDLAVREHGIEVLATLLRPICDAPPNGDHRFFAHHLNAGGTHVTGNFDTCIERAGGYSSRIVHFHGSLGIRDDGTQLGVRISKIDPGFYPEVKSELNRALENTAVLVVVGYGGVDYFDVNPYWRELASQGWFNRRTLLWIDHRQEGWRVSAGRDSSIEMLRRLSRDWNLHSFEVQAPTRGALNLFARQWGMDPIVEPPRSAPWASPTLNLSPRARSRATTRFFVFAGLHKDARTRLGVGPYSGEELSWAAELAWTAGAYRECLRLWSDQFSGDDSENRAKRAERVAASRWLRGQLVRSLLQLERELKAAFDSGKVPVELLVTMSETLGRIFVAMRRLPDVRFLASHKRRDRIVDFLDRAEAQMVIPLGAELRHRTNSVRSALIGVTTDRDGPPVSESFGESERLIGMLNYRHGEYRQLASNPNGPWPSEEDYQSLTSGFRTLGDYADAARTPLLPRSEQFFTPSAVWRGFSETDFTLYHRLRLFIGWYLIRLRATIRGKSI